MFDYITKVDLNGFEQKIHVKGTTTENPIILFLHGGPGVSNRHFIMKNNSDLCDDFTIVSWDQRGTAGSYKNCDPKTLTIKQLVSDANCLVNWLCNRYNKDKIFIIGGSWGSTLGSLLAYYHPEHIAGYIGFGQVVNGPLNEKLSYDFALEQAKKHNDEKSIKILEEIGEPINGNYKQPYQGMMAQRKIMMKYGGYSQDKQKRSYFQSVAKPVLTSNEYSISDIIGYINGYSFVLKNMWPEVASHDLKSECKEFKVPYFIFDGRLDMNTPASLVQDYYDNLIAPQKDLIWFEKSGHNPLSDEADLFKQKIREKFLPIAKQGNKI